MKKIILLSFLALTFFQLSILANSGIFDAYVIYDLNGSGNRYSNALSSFNGATFDNPTSFILNGGQNKTFKNGGSNVTGGGLQYRIYNSTGSAPSFSYCGGFPWKSDESNGDQTWEKNDGNINILNGLSPGIYTLELYFEAYTSDGNKYFNNTNANFKATIMIYNKSVNTGDWNSTSTWSSGIPIENQPILIQNGHNVTLNTNASISYLKINSGGTFTASDASPRILTTLNRGTFTNNGTFNAGTGTVAFAGSATIAGIVAFNNASIAGAVNFGTESTLNGTLTVNANGTALTNAPTYGANSTLDFASGGSYTIDGASTLWVAGSTLGKGVPKNVVVSTTTPLNIYAARDVTGNLTINTGKSIVQGNNAFIVKGNLDNYGTYSFVSNGASKLLVYGNFYNYSTGTTTLSAAVGGDLQINGNLNDNGTFISNNRAIFFNGGNTQVIQGTGVFDIAYVIIDKTGGSVNIVTNLISDVLTLTAGTLNVRAGKHLTVSTTLTNNGTLNLLSDATGTATILTPTSISGSGTANVEQYLTFGRNWYISSPVEVATSNVVAANMTNPLYYYVETVPNQWTEITNASTGLDLMKGYVANISSDRSVTFTGTLNTGPKSISTLTSNGASFTGYNLIGNPYPSYVNWDNATKTNVSTSIWYRSKSTGVYLFQTYNSSGGASANGGSAIIPPMQAFWVNVTSGTGTVGFVNDDRSHQDQTIATNRLKAPVVNSQQLLRLQVSNSVNSDEAVIYFDANAQNGYDIYDSKKMSNNSDAIPEIFTMIGSDKLVINGMSSLPLGTEIPLGFKTLKKGMTSFSIQISQLSNFNSDTQVILKDNQNNSNPIHDITAGTPYTFTSDSLTTENRFSIIFRSAGATTDSNKSLDDENISIYKNSNNHVSIVCSNSNSTSLITVYNTLGQRVVTKKIVGNLTIIDTPFRSGVYVVSVTNSGKSITKKTILE